MSNKIAFDALWDESPIDVTPEVNFIWSIANKLRGSYMPDKYGDVIIPMTILRRLKCALEPTKKAVTDMFAKNPNYPPKAMYRISGYQFYNTSPYTLKELCNEPDNIKSNFKVYIQGFSAEVQEIFNGLEMFSHIDKMDKDGCLFSVVQAFDDLDLDPKTYDSIKMGYIFEHLIGKFYQNVDAGQFYTGRDIIKCLVAVLISEGCDDIFDDGKVVTVCDQACGTGGMMWFREMIYFSRDYSDIPRQLLEYPNDANILRAISNYAKAADVGIEDMRFEINGKQIDEEAASSEEIRAELVQFMRLLSETSNDSETNLKAISIHQGKDKIGKTSVYTMELADESDGTRKLMALAPAIESVLTKGGLLLVDGIEKELHPALVEFVIAKFQSKKTNPNGAQIVFTTHNTDLLDMELLRKDQLYFVDKNSEGVSELYGIRDFSTCATANIRKGYLIGKYGATPNIEIEEL